MIASENCTAWEGDGLQVRSTTTCRPIMRRLGRSASASSCTATQHLMAGTDLQGIASFAAWRSGLTKPSSSKSEASMAKQCLKTCTEAHCLLCAAGRQRPPGCCKCCSTLPLPLTPWQHCEITWRPPCLKHHQQWQSSQRPSGSLAAESARGRSGRSGNEACLKSWRADETPCAVRTYAD